MKKKSIIKKFKPMGGLRETPQDDRDFRLGNIQKVGKVEDLPKEFVIGEPLLIFNQLSTDMCAAFSVVAALQFSEEITLSPEFQFTKIKQIAGEWNEWGATLRDACKSAVKIGALENQDSPMSVEKDDRDKIANWENWPISLDEKAEIHRQKSYFRID